MNTGPSGFAHAPVTKGIVFVAGGASLLAHAARAGHRAAAAAGPGPLSAAGAALAFRSPGEAVCGCLLLYYFRVLERGTGSTKYGAYVAAVTGLSVVLQLVAARLVRLAGGGGLAAALGGGGGPVALLSPLPLVFASFVPFALDVPACSTFQLLGLRLSDKVFVYIGGLQLLLSSGRRSLLAGAAGLLAGLLFRSNFCGVQRLKLPAALVRFCSRTLGPLLSEARPGPQVMVAAAGPGGQQARFGVAGGAPAGQPGAQAQAPGAPLPAANPEALETLIAMGFDRAMAEHALQHANNDVQAALQLLL